MLGSVFHCFGYAFLFCFPVCICKLLCGFVSVLNELLLYFKDGCSHIEVMLSVNNKGNWLHWLFFCEVLHT